MAKQAKPFYRSDRKAWYVRIDGKRIALNLDQSATAKQIQTAFYAILKADRTEKQKRYLLKDIVGQFNRENKDRLSAGCYRNYDLFGRTLNSQFGNLKADELKPYQLEQFSRSNDWSNTYRHQFIGFCMTLYRWAVKSGLLKSNPLQHINRPPKRSRGTEAVLTAEEHKQLIQNADTDLADFLQLLWLTGARPSEIAGLTVQQVKQSVNGVIVLTDHKQAYQGKQRHLILNDEAVQIVKRRAEGTDGLLFSGQNGRITATAIGSRLRRLTIKLGMRRVVPYGYRHTFATDALTNGIADVHVASLLGHASTTMLHKHYSHLTARMGMLRQVIQQVR